MSYDVSNVYNVANNYISNAKDDRKAITSNADNENKVLQKQKLKII